MISKCKYRRILILTRKQMDSIEPTLKSCGKTERIHLDKGVVCRYKVDYSTGGSPPWDM